MYNDYINNKIKEKIAYDFDFIKDCLIIKFKLFFNFNNVNVNNKLEKLRNDYLKYSLLEYKLLINIKKIKDDSDFSNYYIKILEELETMFNSNYNYIENILLGYEKMLENNNIYYSLFQEQKFDIDYLIYNNNLILKRLK